VDRLIDAGYRALARSDLAVRTALRTRNIANALIGHRLSDTILPERNGEVWLIRHLAPRCRVAIDVGANVGAWSACVLDAAPEVRLIAYEPSTSACAAFRRRHDDRVEFVEAAVADQPGELDFFEEPEAGETSSLVRNARGRRRSVRVVTLDDELQRLDIDRVDLLKIDAEGYDLHVLRGARRALEAGRIAAVQFEYNASWAGAGSTLAAALALLEGAGFTVHLLRGGGLEPVDYDRYGEHFSYSNYVALREP
jgi:FkbM family methyltransferase